MSIALFDLEKEMAPCDLEQLSHKINSIPWISDIPGGFVTNSPKRNVFTYGNGEGIDSNGCLNNINKIETTYWTPKISANNCTLYSVPNRMPKEFLSLIVLAKSLFTKTMKNVHTSDYTFNIAVCNFYNEHNMCICPHTDDNVWYPNESDNGPVFASLTIYPNKKPTCQEEYARFNVKLNNKWEQINLPHNSLAIMPSSLEHRVQPHTKKNSHFFCPRINITFRSSYDPKIDPLLHRMAVSNHTRYYSFPIAIRIPFCVHGDIQNIIDSYNTFLKKHNKNPLIVYTKDLNKHTLILQYTKSYNIRRLLPTMVAETFIDILCSLNGI